MNEVKRYHVGDTGLVEGESLGRINVVLGSDYEQLTSKVGNMVCAKRQMDEELENARDDLVIFKGALSALGEASKKLVVCARTTGGTAGPDQGLMDACAGVEGVITLAGVARAMNEFERMQAERDALQLLLNERDEQTHNLEQSRRAEFDNGQAVDRKIAELGYATCDVIAERKRQMRVEGWTLEGDDRTQGKLAAAAACYLLFSGDYPNAGHPPPMWPWSAKWWKPKDYRRDLIRAGALVLAEIERIDRAAIKPATEACEFPQSCTTGCDCKPAARDDDIPDFSPGNGNKARRRAEALGASKFSDANEPPCSACFARGCNGECMENL